jgi:putative addiction module CopG family antidote
METSMSKPTSLHVSLPEDLEEFVRQEVAEGGYGTPDDFVRTVLRERREQKARRQIDDALLASLQTPSEAVTPAYLASLRSEAQALIGTKAARKPAKEV